MLFALDQAALLIIDVQKGFDNPTLGRRNNPQAEANIVRLLTCWRVQGWPIIHVWHHVTTPTPPSASFVPTLNASSHLTGTVCKDLVRPLSGEAIITKQTHSAFIGTNLESFLRQQQITTLVITGLTSNHCIETTTRMAGDLGFRGYFVADATATFDRTGPNGVLYRAEMIQEMTQANLHEEFAQVVTTDQLLQESITCHDLG